MPLNGNVDRMLTRAVRRSPTWGREWGIVLRKPRLRKALIKLLINSKAHVSAWEADATEHCFVVDRYQLPVLRAKSFHSKADNRTTTERRCGINHLWAVGSGAGAVSNNGKADREKRRSNWAHDK
jgi:hypothetical protein